MCLNNSLLYLKYIVIFSIYRLDKFSPFPAFLFCIHLQIVLTSAWELTLDLLNLEDFGFLDPDLDSRKGQNNNQKLKNNFFTLHSNPKLLKMRDHEILRF